MFKLLGFSLVAAVLASQPAELPVVAAIVEQPDGQQVFGLMPVVDSTPVATETPADFVVTVTIDADEARETAPLLLPTPNRLQRAGSFIVVGLMAFLALVLEGLALLIMLPMALGALALTPLFYFCGGSGPVTAQWG